jgi:hypothetical protein
MRLEAALALSTSDPGQPPAWRARIAELPLRKDHLKVELARLDVTFRGEQAEAGREPDRLQAALPRATALIDLPEFWALTPPAEKKGKFRLEHRLVAFVVRPDRSIVRTDLEPLAPICKAIEKPSRVPLRHRPGWRQPPAHAGRPG